MRINSTGRSLNPCMSAGPGKRFTEKPVRSSRALFFFCVTILLSPMGVPWPDRSAKAQEPGAGKSGEQETGLQKDPRVEVLREAGNRNPVFLEPSDSEQSSDAQGCTVSTRSINRFPDPVVIRGEILEGLLGSPVKDMRLFAWQKAGPGPIPFQVDEYTDDERKVLPQGVENNREEGNGILDRQDEVAFMAHDLGDRVLPACWPQGVRKGLELEVVDPVNRSRGWSYLFLYEGNPPPLSSTRYVDYDWEENRIRTPYYDNLDQVEKKGKNIYRKIFYVSMDTTPHGGGQGVDFIDTMKFYGEANLLYSLITFRADHGDVAADTIAYRLGPVRGIRRCYGVIKLPFGLNGPKIVTDVGFYESLFSCPLVTHVPFNPRTVFTNIKVRFGTDLNKEGAGMLFFNSNNPLGFLADGRQAPAEKSMDVGRDEWRLYTGPQGTLMMRSVWDPTYVEQATINVYFEDDSREPDPPEHVPGNYGASYSVSTLENIKAGDYCAWLDWYFPPHFYNPEHPTSLDREKIRAYLNLHDHPLEIRVQGKQMLNRTKLPQVREE